jgi:flotillin
MLPENKMCIGFTLFQVKIQGQNEEMLLAACEQFLGKQESEIQHIALVTLEGHQRAIMGSMTVEVSA